MKIIGITGTNGKTTVTHLLKHILTDLGYKTGLIGTINARLTTPSPWELAEYLAAFRQDNYQFAVLEVSSHGIKQDRIRGIDFTVKGLTNITRDHLDYHKTFRDYKHTKLSWIRSGLNIKIYPSVYRKYQIDFDHPLLGEFNNDNIKMVLAICDHLGIDLHLVKRSLTHAAAIPGRFELVNKDMPYKVIVDYAHTPDGLLNAVKSARTILKKEKQAGRLITLFGCGGDRDKGKRPQMGRIAYHYSDHLLITSDNPRSEKPEMIIKDILAGIKTRSNKSMEIIVDRETAIKTAIEIAENNDLVLVAGKGHEDYQIIGEQRISFDDKKICQKYLKY